MGLNIFEECMDRGYVCLFSLYLLVQRPDLQVQMHIWHVEL